MSCDDSAIAERHRSILLGEGGARTVAVSFPKGRPDGERSNILKMEVPLNG